MTQNENLARLSAAGVSVWLDDLSRERLQTGNLQELIDTKSVVGVTTNPSIFQAALSSGHAYDDQVNELAARGADVEATIRTVTTDDVRNACDVLAKQYEQSDGVDGRVSIEVDPRMAHDTDKTILQAIDLWKTVDRPNLLIKIPATLAGIPAITAAFPHHLVGGRQDYRRHFIAMEGSSFDDYLARFSGKTRSTLRRKGRKLAKDAGDYTVTEHRTAQEIERFLDAALPLSAKTYQARLLDAGLPDSAEARAAMLEAAEDDRMRCFLLLVGDTPIAYLSLPVVGRTLVYAHLGYDPDFARLSPGTVLQLEALERLFAERRYAHFDFTEGEGAHKAMFGTDHADCASFVLLDPTLANRALLGARSTFDGAVSGVKALAERSGTLAKVRSALRS